MDLSFDILLRLLTAFVLGAIIGIERDVHGRAAGIRTNMLVCVGSALFTLASLIPEGGDKGRIAAQIVSGIGFLGAGTIIKSGLNIRGLTTAACMWLVAAIGMLCGFNQLLLAIIVTSIAMVILLLAKSIENRLHRLYSIRLSVDTTDENFPELLNELLKEKPGYSITSLDISRDSENLWHYDIIMDVNSNVGPMHTDIELLRQVSVRCNNLRRIRVAGLS
jgi:putative Mg2+ transporter-C (MgtC) family protein